MEKRPGTIALANSPHLAYPRTMSSKHQQTVAVALSGGADSLYSLMYLKEQGYSVFGLHGIFLKPENERQSHEASAMRERLAVACERLGVILHVADLREEFERLVIRPFVEAYALGLTPNPCAHCNAAVKFGLLQDAARQHGAHCLATGHYAALCHNNEAEGVPALYQAQDTSKDQSYFLALVPGDRLASAFFPLEAMHKTDLLATLRDKNITPPQPGESQEVCFIPGDEYRDYVPRMAKRFGITLPGPGAMVVAEGTKELPLGKHQGLWRFTEGQRRGLGVGWKEPLYVIEKDMAHSILRLGPKVALHASGCECDTVNYLLPFDSWPEKVLVKTRYRERPKAATAEIVAKGTLRIRFAATDSAVAAGQIAAVYLPEPDSSDNGMQDLSGQYPEGPGRLRLIAGGVITRGI